MGWHTRTRQKSEWTFVERSPAPRVRSLADYRWRRRQSLLATGVAAFLLVFLIGMLMTVWRPSLPAFAQSMLQEDEASFTCSVGSVTDGDTFRCREQDSAGRSIRVRLSGVAARESDGSCSPGHPCPSSSAEVATAELQRLTAAETLTCRPVGKTYGRVAAFCTTSAGTDLSCAMVDSGTVLKWPKYWGLHRCP